MIRLLRKYVFHNFWLKLTSLAVAVLLWIAVARDPLAEVAVTVPIEFHHVPDGLEISSEKIPEAQVRVRGPGRIARGVAQTEVRAAIDLSNAAPGERTYDLTAAQIHVPRDLEVVNVVPSELRLVFDRRARKQVPIKARVIGLSAAGPRPEILVDPPTALIVGPEKRVQSIDSAFTDAVNAEGVAGTAAFPGVHVYATDPLVRVVQPASVAVTVNLVEPGKSGRAQTAPARR